MSNKSSVSLTAFLLFAAFLTAALVVEEFSVLAQNTNSSTTEETMQSTNVNRSRRGRRRGRRGRRRPAANANADATMAPSDANLSSDANVSAMSGGMTENLGGGMDEDLSGTYTGHVTMTGGHEMSGQATLTITGNTFTLESEGMNHTGRVRAVTTRGYTGATFWFTDITDSATNTPLAAAVRARRTKTATQIWLSPVPGARNRLTFSAGGGRRRRGHH